MLYTPTHNHLVRGEATILPGSIDGYLFCTIQLEDYEPTYSVSAQSFEHLLLCLGSIYISLGLIIRGRDAGSNFPAMLNSACK